MLNQNTKGFLTLLTVTGIISSVFYGYKGFVEPKLIRNSELFPVDIEEVNLTPKVSINTDKAYITWESPDKNGGVIFSVKKEDCIEKNKDCKSKTGTVTGNTHTVEIDNLLPGKDYYYKITVSGKEFPQEKNTFFSFKRPEPTAKEKAKTNKRSRKEDLKKIREAIKDQDLMYDLNKDGKVTIADLYLLDSKSPK